MKNDSNDKPLTCGHFRWLDSLDVARRPIRTCSDCGWRLEPANDTHVGGVPAAGLLAIEVRAAEIAAMRRPNAVKPSSASYIDGAEYAGWLEHAHDSAKVPVQPGEWAGWLARQIKYGDHEPTIDALADAADMAEVEHEGCENCTEWTEAILPEPFEETDDQSARDALTAGDGVIDGGL